MCNALLRFRTQSPSFIKSLPTRHVAEGLSLPRSEEGLLVRTAVWAQCQGHHFPCIPLANPVYMEVLFGLRSVSRIPECPSNISKIWREGSLETNGTVRAGGKCSLCLRCHFPSLSVLASLELVSFPLRVWAPLRPPCPLHLSIPPSRGAGHGMSYVAATSRRLSNRKLSSVHLSITTHREVHNPLAFYFHLRRASEFPLVFWRQKLMLFFKNMGWWLKRRRLRTTPSIPYDAKTDGQSN